MITIRDVQKEDISTLLHIYAYYVENTAITFEYEVPSLAEFTQRIDTITKRYPYLVIEMDNQIQGYAYASCFKDRAAYDWSCEVSIYLDTNAKGMGLGKKLYEALEARLKAMDILNVYACITYPKVDDVYVTKNSQQFHEHLGYQIVGTFHQCGYKFDTWYDMIWMEKMIGEHEKHPSNMF